MKTANRKFIMPITKQTIAIIGADSHTGSVVAKNIAGGNYRLLLFSDDVSNVQPLAEEIMQSDSSADIDIDVRDCQFEACWEADIIFMAIPYSDYKPVAKKIKKVATQKIVISISSETGATEKLHRLLPNSKIVKIFNADFTQPIINHEQAKVTISGDNAKAVEIVSELLKTAGFAPTVTENLETVRI